MKHILRIFAAVAIALSLSTSASADVTVGVSTSGGGVFGGTATPWLGFMNVFELPADPNNITPADYTSGGFVFGSGWGVADLVVNFDDANKTVTLLPNSIGDPNEFWYQNTTGNASDPSNPGGPGQMGNKIMEANFFQQVSGGVISNETLTFEGEILSDTFTGAHFTEIFIKEFDVGFNLISETRQLVNGPGAFSISQSITVNTDSNIQWGFATVGQNVWITDIAPFGSVQIASVPEPGSLAVLGLCTMGLVAIRRRR